MAICNSLADLLVFGKRAGEAAQAYLQGLAAVPRADPAEVAEAARQVLEPLGRTAGENPHALQGELQQVMDEHAGIARSGHGLERGLTRILELAQRTKGAGVGGSRRYNPGWHAVMDLRAMLVLCEAIVRSALARQESRGNHWRTDHPQQDPALGGVNFTARLARGAMCIALAPVPEMPPELRRLFDSAIAPGASAPGAAGGGR